MTEVQVISMEADCSRECSDFVDPLFEQLSSGKYDQCAVQRIVDVSEWRATHRTARKRSGRATRLGYECVPVARHEYADDIYAINTSAPKRQGRRMSDAYWQAVSKTPDKEYRCPRHGVHYYGVVDAHGTLVAYLWCYRAGELALVSQILGHADHLGNDVMYLLFEGAMKREYALSGSGFFVYNRADSGTDGLRYFKDKLGFEARGVVWELL